MPTDDAGTVETTQDAEETTAERTTETTKADTSEAADDYAELKAAIAKERDASKAAKSELKKAMARLSELENAGKPELEKITAERDTLKAQLGELSVRVRETEARDAVVEQARKAGATKPELVWRLVRADVEYDDDGTATNLGDLLKDAKALVPEMFRAAANADSGNGAGTPAASNDWLRNALSARR